MLFRCVGRSGNGSGGRKVPSCVVHHSGWGCFLWSFRRFRLFSILRRGVVSPVTCALDDNVGGRSPSMMVSLVGCNGTDGGATLQTCASPLVGAGPSPPPFDVEDVEERMGGAAANEVWSGSLCTGANVVCLPCPLSSSRPDFSFHAFNSFKYLSFAKVVESFTKRVDCE